MIVKCGRRLYPSALDVRAETFGIFLIHPVLVAISEIAVLHIAASKRMAITENGPLTLLLSVAMFVTIYTASVLATKQIRRVSFLRWTVGQ